MKKITPFILALFVSSVCFAQQPLNAGFETGPDTLHATSWDSPNTILGGLGQAPTFSRNSPGYNSTYSARMQSKLIFGSTVAPGAITLGQFVLNGLNLEIVGGQAFVDRPDTLKGFFKHPTTGDVGSILVGISKWNTGTGTRDTIATGALYITQTTGTWTPFEVLFNYTSGATPDTLNIIIYSSELTANSLFFVDDLHLGYLGGLSSQPITMTENGLSLYPNPAKNTLNVNTNFTDGTTTVVLYDVIGKELYKTQNNLKQQTIDVSEYPAGLYFVEAINNGHKFVQKIVIRK